jgi:(p)ppGpp synthase/HD superfamily hydrolase
MNNWDQEKYIKAWDFATRYHAGQTYGGPKPEMRIDYLNHIGSVAMEIIWVMQSSSNNYNADLAIQCAILHDTLEDTEAKYDELKITFGKDVANGVMALTKNEKLPNKEEQMQDSLARIKQQPKEIAMVKMADRISNLYHPPYYWKNEKINLYLNEANLIYQELSEADELLAQRLKEKMELYRRFITN